MGVPHLKPQTSSSTHQVDESRARPGATSRPSIGKAMARIGSNDSTLRYIEAAELSTKVSPADKKNVMSRIRTTALGV